MKIQIGQIEGKTSKKGTKQNRVYVCCPAKTNNFYDSDCGKKSIWNVNGDWSLVGVMSLTGRRRVSYTTDFKIIEL